MALFALKRENNNALWIFGGRVIFQIECTKPILSLMQFTFKTPIPRILLMSFIYQYMTSYMRTVFTLEKENLAFEHCEFHSKWQFLNIISIESFVDFIVDCQLHVHPLGGYKIKVFKYNI